MKLLFAEDDRDLCQAVRVLLERSGYSVDVVHNGADAVDYAAGGDYDGLILDWMMPRMDGVEALRRLRGKGVDTPCLMLTARDGVEDRVEGLDAGADDYLAKPFHVKELLARIRAMLRRRSAIRPDLLRFANLELDRSTMELRCGDQAQKLTNKAFQLMEMLMENPRAVLSADRIMEHVWGWESESEVNVLWVNISSLRKKLAELGAQAEIRAVRGVGYSLEEKS
ncbi:MAG: response regulator transcription factor [Oscillospiraceae bacterium]|nr:response regulator transcription factor [Oscillospiraceae bacterium]